jgi:hypothetical protein
MGLKIQMVLETNGLAFSLDCKTSRDEVGSSILLFASSLRDEKAFRICFKGLYS